MADDLGVQFFATAKRQYESSEKWRLIVVAVIAYLCVALVMPFAEQMSEKSAVDSDIAGYRSAESALKPVLAAAADLAGSLNAEADDHANVLRDDLVRRFSALSKEVKDHANPDGGAPTPSTDLQFGNTEIDCNPAMQMPTEGCSAPDRQIAPGQLTPQSVLAPLPSELREQIINGSAFPSPREVSSEFAAYIETAIIAPAFERANKAWKSSVLADLNERAGRLDGEIQNAKAKAQSAAAELNSLADTIAELRAEAEKLTFAPPDDPKWWWTVGRKERFIQSMMEGFQKKVGDIDKRQLVLTDMQAKATEIVSQKEEVMERIKSELNDLEKQASDLQSQLRQIGVPLQVVNFKLSQLAPLMPLIVGLALAGIAAWSAEGLRRMTLAARLVGDPGQAHVVRTWLASAAGGSPGRITVRELLLAIVSVGWILAVAWIVWMLAVPFLTPPIILAGAIAAVVAARLYHWYQARDALAAASG